MFIEELLAALGRAQVRYCLVGGVAVNLHGIPRMTYDVDLVASMTRESLEALDRTLSGLGLKSRIPVKLPDLSDDALRIELRDERNLIALTFTDPSNPLREVDVLVSPAVPSEDLVARAVRIDVSGMAVWIASLQDLIALKRASDRKQDADDVRLLEGLKR